MRRSTTFRLAASAAALSVIVGAGAYGTYSAFTDTTDNTGNTFAAGTIDITDDDAGTAMFTLTGMLPGSTATRCINVSNVGTSPFANVALSGAVGGTGLATALTVVVDRGTGAGGGATFSCTGFASVTANIVTGALSAFPTVGGAGQRRHRLDAGGRQELSLHRDPAVYRAADGAGAERDAGRDLDRLLVGLRCPPSRPTGPPCRARPRCRGADRGPARCWAGRRRRWSSRWRSPTAPCAWLTGGR